MKQTENINIIFLCFHFIQAENLNFHFLFNTQGGLFKNFRRMKNHILSVNILEQQQKWIWSQSIFKFSVSRIGLKVNKFF